MQQKFSLKWIESSARRQWLKQTPFLQKMQIKIFAETNQKTKATGACTYIFTCSVHSIIISLMKISYFKKPSKAKKLLILWQCILNIGIVFRFITVAVQNSKRWWNLILTEVETLANFKHHLHTSGCQWQACTETVNSFNKDEFTCQLNTILCDMSLQSAAPFHQISTHTSFSRQCFH